jgi:hypothetical protein
LIKKYFMGIEATPFLSVVAQYPRIFEQLKTLASVASANKTAGLLPPNRSHGHVNRIDCASIFGNTSLITTLINW